jgi:hypothetical protein
LIAGHYLLDSEVDFVSFIRALPLKKLVFESELVLRADADDLSQMRLLGTGKTLYFGDEVMQFLIHFDEIFYSPTFQ